MNFPQTKDDNSSIILIGLNRPNFKAALDKSFFGGLLLCRVGWIVFCRNALVFFWLFVVHLSSKGICWVWLVFNNIPPAKEKTLLKWRLDERVCPEEWKLQFDSYSKVSCFFKSYLYNLLIVWFLMLSMYTGEGKELLVYLEILQMLTSEYNFMTIQ